MKTLGPIAIRTLEQLAADINRMPYIPIANFTHVDRLIDHASYFVQGITESADTPTITFATKKIHDALEYGFNTVAPIVFSDQGDAATFFHPFYHKYVRSIVQDCFDARVEAETNAMLGIHDDPNIAEITVELGFTHHVNIDYRVPMSCLKQALTLIQNLAAYDNGFGAIIFDDVIVYQLEETDSDFIQHGKSIDDAFFDGRFNLIERLAAHE